MTARLLAMYQNGAITAGELVVELLLLIDPLNPGFVLSALPSDILPRVLEFARSYQPGKMLTNYGSIPTSDQVMAALRWIEGERANA